MYPADPTIDAETETAIPDAATHGSWTTVPPLGDLIDTDEE